MQGKAEPPAASATNPMMADERAPGPPAESVKKLDQIVQNFFNKVAVLVLDSRLSTRHTKTANGQKKLNKWVRGCPWTWEQAQSRWANLM